MCALFYDAAVVEDNDMVCVLDGGETVCNDEAGSFLHDLMECLLDEVLRGRVEGRGGFV